MPRPPMIRTDSSNAFAHHTMSVRVPAILRETIRLNPDYPTSVHGALEKLAQDIETNQPIPMIELPAPDYDDWAADYARYEGDSWLQSDWFFAELFVYRHVIQATRWWETGRDPFAPKKVEEYQDEALWLLLNRTLSLEGNREERLLRLLLSSLWGNRIDLSYAIAAKHGGLSESDEDLLVDDSAKAVEYLLTQQGAVHLIADNTGTELAMDLALIDMLLREVADQVVLHLKLHPTFVSDATPQDVLLFLQQYVIQKPEQGIKNFGRRLTDALESGRLRLAPDWFWNSARPMWQMPPRLIKTLQSARLVILKGDANYRRLLGDAIYEPTTPFVEVIRDFPAPLLALRSLKSDPIVGLPAGMSETLNAADANWRVNGRRGVCQMRP